MCIRDSYDDDSLYKLLQEKLNSLDKMFETQQKDVYKRQGSIPELLQEFPGIKIVGNKTTFQFIKDLYKVCLLYTSRCV